MRKTKLFKSTALASGDIQLEVFGDGAMSVVHVLAPEIVGALISKLLDDLATVKPPTTKDGLPYPAAYEAVVRPSETAVFVAEGTTEPQLALYFGRVRLILEGPDLRDAARKDLRDAARKLLADSAPVAATND